MKSHSQMMLPPQIRAKARVEVGDLFKAKIDGRTITSAPKSMINRELTVALHDAKRGWGKCPFSTAHATALRFVAGQHNGVLHASLSQAIPASVHKASSQA